MPVHKNTVGDLIRDAARRRSQDRDLTDEIKRGVAVQRQLVEDLMRDFRAVGSGTTRRANARAKLASQIIKAQMNLLFLSGVEVPDPERIVTDVLEEVGLPMPDPADLLAQPVAPIGAPKTALGAPIPVPDPPEEHVIAPHAAPVADTERDLPERGIIAPEKAPRSSSDDGDDEDFTFFGPAIDY